MLAIFRSVLAVLIGTTCANVITTILTGATVSIASVRTAYCPVGAVVVAVFIVLADSALLIMLCAVRVFTGTSATGNNFLIFTAVIEAIRTENPVRSVIIGVGI